MTSFNEARKEVLEGLKFAYENEDGKIIFPTGVDVLYALHELVDILSSDPNLVYTSESRASLRTKSALWKIKRAKGKK